MDGIYSFIKGDTDVVKNFEKIKTNNNQNGNQNGMDTTRETGRNGTGRRGVGKTDYKALENSEQGSFSMPETDNNVTPTDNDSIKLSARLSFPITF